MIHEGVNLLKNEHSRYDTKCPHRGFRYEIRETQGEHLHFNNPIFTRAYEVAKDRNTKEKGCKLEYNFN